MKSFLICLAVFAALYAKSGFAYYYYRSICASAQDPSGRIELEFENGVLLSAIYSNISSPPTPSKALSPYQYSFEGTSIDFSGATYLCRIQ